MAGVARGLRFAAVLEEPEEETAGATCSGVCPSQHHSAQDPFALPLGWVLEDGGQCDSGLTSVPWSALFSCSFFPLMERM